MQGYLFSHVHSNAGQGSSGTVYAGTGLEVFICNGCSENIGESSW